MPNGKVTWYKLDRGFGFIAPADGGDTIFFHDSACAEGDQIAVGSVVAFEVGIDGKTGKSKATVVDVV